MTDVPIEEAKLIGGSPQDRRRLLERLHEYLDINARFDWEPLQDLWSGMPETVFFNLNGGDRVLQPQRPHLYRPRALDAALAVLSKQRREQLLDPV